MQPSVKIVDQFGAPMRANASVGGFGGQLAGWTPPVRSANAAMLPDLNLNTGRADELVQTNAMAKGAMEVHKDNIVGSLFRLAYNPRWQQLGVKENEMRAFVREVENWWAEYAEDPDGCYIDAERKRTFTMMIREGVGTHFSTGDTMSAALWLDRPGSLFKTCIKRVSPKRVSNPDGMPDTATLSGGIESDRYGAPVAFYVRSMNEGGFEFGSGYGHTWERIPLETKHGRRQFIHVFEPTEDGQSRGANKLIAAMEQMHMLPKLQHTKLQNAIVNAMYAATIESDLGEESAMAALDDAQGLENLSNFMAEKAKFGGDIKMDGAKAIHLFGGERFNLQTSGNSDNGYVPLEESIQRWMARATNVSFESLTQNYSKGNYSSIRASMLDNHRYMMGQRKVIASREASQIFNLFLEEAIARKIIKLPRGATRGFYEAKGSWCNASWVGSGFLAIDGLKEVKMAVLRIVSGLSTYQKELALMGEDYQEVFAQQVREMEERSAAGLPPASWAMTEAFAPNEAEQPNPNTANDR